MSAPLVELRLPTVLEPVVGARTIQIRGRTLAEAFEAAYQKLPRLRHHIAADAGTLRPHILCILNDENIPRERLAETPLQEGDQISIHQAISGG